MSTILFSNMTIKLFCFQVVHTDILALLISMKSYCFSRGTFCSMCCEYTEKIDSCEPALFEFIRNTLRKGSFGSLPFMSCRLRLPPAESITKKRRSKELVIHTWRELPKGPYITICVEKNSNLSVKFLYMF